MRVRAAIIRTPARRGWRLLPGDYLGFPDPLTMPIVVGGPAPSLDFSDPDNSQYIPLIFGDETV